MNRYIINSTIGSLGDFATEWWTDEDWAKWNVKVEKWKADGVYGQKVTYTVDLINNPRYDAPKYSNALQSSKIEFIDLSAPQI